MWLAKMWLECLHKSAKLEARIQVAFALQAKFGSLDQLAAVKKTVRACLRSEIASRNWYLYIAPPKQVRMQSLCGQATATSDTERSRQ